LIFIKHHKQTVHIVKAIMVLLMVITIMAILDVVSDINHQVPWAHVLVELAIIFSAIVVVILGAHWFYRVSEESMVEFEDTLKFSRAELKFWREEHRQLLQGVAQKIQEQFAVWQLTRAEIEIGFFLLKGFNAKEIAQHKGVTEKTVREHASNIYRKSNLAGRSELSAYFLEDLLAPIQE
jgi:DNA-binding NarL/FixJ family response regulator